MKIVIIGAGGHGRVILDIIRSNHQFEVAGFLDADPALKHVQRDGLQILGNISMLEQLPKMGIKGAVIAIGDNKIRRNYAEQVENAGLSLVSAIHPSANIASTASIGKNVVIAAGVNICTAVTIHDSAILNTGCIIDHESEIHDAVHICPGVKLAGHVQVQRGAFIGIGATIIQGIQIGEAAVVGAGAVVLKHVPPFSTVVGVPARVVKSTHIPGIAQELQASTAEVEPARSLITRPKRRRPTPEQIPVEI